jgi:hypothetical protein
MMMWARHVGRGWNISTTHAEGYTQCRRDGSIREGMAARHNLGLQFRKPQTYRTDRDHETPKAAKRHPQRQAQQLW